MLRQWYDPGMSDDRASQNGRSTAPLWDDEPLTAEELRQVEMSERAIAAGEPMLTTAELEAEFETVRA